MFKTITAYQLTQATGAVLKRLAPALENHEFQSCGTNAQKSSGFVPPLQGSDEFTYETQGGVLFCLRQDEKSLPSRYVKEEVAKQVDKREADGEELSKVDKRLIKEEVSEALLPGIPPEPSRTYAYIDKNLGMLFVEANEEDADAFMTQLKGALEGLPFKLLGIEKEPCDIFTDWLRDPTKLGEDFTLGDNCSLKHAKEGGTAVINIQHEELESEEMDAMIEAGKECCRIGLAHEDATFALTAKLGIRRLSLDADREIEADDDGGDIPAQFAVLVTVVRNILGALEPLLGGWPKQELLDLGDEQGETA